MNFDLTDDQRQIQRTASELLANRFRPERVRELAESQEGLSDDDWREVSDLGWPGVAVPEEHGGLGLGIVELVVISEQLGYALAPLPYLSAVAASLCVQAAGSDEQKGELLPGLATGESRATLALVDSPDRPAGVRQGRLEGSKDLVIDADGADLVLVDAGDGPCHVVDGGSLSTEPAPTLDSTRRTFRVALDGAPAERVLGGREPGLAWALDAATVALSAELVGIAQRAMEMAVAYAQERKQFDRPIGAYQAVSHRCAQMLLEVEGARGLTYHAAWAADHDRENLAIAASRAKAYASDAGIRVCESSIQVHGGIGFTWEHDLHLWLKRARADAMLLGDQRFHRERVAGLLGLGSAA